MARGCREGCGTSASAPWLCLNARELPKICFSFPSLSILFFAKRILLLSAEEAPSPSGLSRIPRQ